MGKMFPELKSSSVITRYNGGEPVLSKKDIPYDADCIFNAGVTKFQGRYVLVFRNDYYYDEERGGFDGCVIGIAFSDDGIHWDVQKEPFITVEDLHDPDVIKVYDPRLTVIDGRCYLCFAVDTHHGVRGGVAVTDDLKSIEVLSLSAPDNRNMVLFPEKINGKYVRLERPFPVYSRGGVDRFDMWMSKSPDLRYWGESELLLAVEHVPFANDKIGPGAPPIKTKDGWLVLFHTVDRDETRGKNGWGKRWTKRYCAGVMLLDLENPSKILGMYKEPLIAPEGEYEENEGFRTNVIFPGGLIAEDDGTVKIYYGLNDTVECMATAKIQDLIDLCLGENSEVIK